MSTFKLLRGRSSYKLDALQNQVTELFRARETTTENPELLSEVQNLKETVGEHSKQQEQSAENLSQIEAENLILQDENQDLHTTGNKQCQFWTWVLPMQPLNTPTDESDEARLSQPQDRERETEDSTARRTRTRTREDSDSEMKDEEETIEAAKASKSTVTSYLEQVFSKKFDAIQSMVERLPDVAPPIRS